MKFFGRELNVFILLCKMCVNFDMELYNTQKYNDPFYTCILSIAVTAAASITRSISWIYRL